MLENSEPSMFKAFKLYIEGESVKTICRKLNVNKRQLTKWMTRHNWEKSREKALEKHKDVITDFIIDQQIEIVKSAQKELVDRLKRQEKARALKTRLEEHFNQLLSNGEISDGDLNAFNKAMAVVNRDMMNDTSLIKLMTHGLDIVRPKTINEMNFMKQDNNNLQILVNIPENVKEMLNEYKQNRE